MFVQRKYPAGAPGFGDLPPSNFKFPPQIDGSRILYLRDISVCANTLLFIINFKLINEVLNNSGQFIRIFPTRSSSRISGSKAFTPHAIKRIATSSEILEFQIQGLEFFLSIKFCLISYYDALFDCDNIYSE